MSDDINNILRRMSEQAAAPRRPRSLDEYRRSFEARMSAFRRLVEAGQAVVEGYLPSDQRDDKRDVAFGVTKKGVYLDASMVDDEEGKPPTNLGLISHSALLVAAGLSKDLDDPKPSDDFAVRGIVKAKLGGRVIFWQDGGELMRNAAYVKTAIDGLLTGKLIDDKTEVYGAGEDMRVVTAYEIKQDW